MKKIHLLFIAVIALLATACEKKVPPTLTLSKGEAYVAEGDEVEVGTEVMFNFISEGKKLETLTVTISSPTANLYSETFNLNGEDHATTTVKQSFNETGRITMNAVLKDAKGQTAITALSFESIAKPTLFFLGYYEGYSVLDGTIVSTLIPYSYPIPPDQNPISAIVTESDQDDMVNISLTYDGITYATTGTIEGVHIDFAPFDVDLEIDGSIVTGTIDLEGDKNGNILIVTGTIEGEGTVNVEEFPVALPVTLSGTVNGEMKQL